MWQCSPEIASGWHMQANEWICMIMLLGASYTDLRKYKIKNVWILLFLFLGVVFFRWDFLCSVLVVPIVLFPLYYVRVIGAGDLKLVSLMIGFLKMQNALKTIYIGLLFAGIYSFYKMFSGKLFFERVNYFIQYIKVTTVTGKIDKYHNLKTDKERITIPMAPFLLMGFLSWRAYVLWKMQA